jgi:predicted RNA-binding protein with TRAM domain
MSTVRVDCMGEHGDGVNEEMYFTVMVLVVPCCNA